MEFPIRFVKTSSRLRCGYQHAEPISVGNYSVPSRNRGHRVKDVIDQLNLYVRGWLNYYKHSSAYSEVKDLAE